MSGLGLSTMIDRYIFTLRTDEKDREKYASHYSCDNPSLQDSDLRARGFYDNLPAIGSSRIVLPIAGFNIRTPVTKFSDAVARIPAEDVGGLESALVFANNGGFINLSRAELADTYVSQDTFLKSAATTGWAWCLMSGVVVSSKLNVYIPQVMGCTRSVTILPFNQEFRRDTAYWAAKFCQREIVTTVTDEGLVFHTRPYGTDMTKVPLFDCRRSKCNFDFSDDSLRTLDEHPRFKLAKGTELPRGSVITVVYALAHTYGRQGPMIIPWIRFILVLGAPDTPAN